MTTVYQDLLLQYATQENAVQSPCVLFGGAMSSSLIETSKNLESFVVEQSEYKLHQGLSKNGVKTVTNFDSPFFSALFLGTRHKGEILGTFLRIFKGLPIGGSFTMVLPNDLGAGRFEKILFSIYSGETFSHSKAKTRVFGFVNFNFESLDKAALIKCQQESSFLPAIFNAGTLDGGSMLLAETLTGKLSGTIAEFCSGSGALGARLIEDNQTVDHIDCYESNHHAVEIANRNPNPKITNHWMDITEIGANRFKTIIMNPPFHSSMGEDQSLGLHCIFTAIRSLRSGGFLYVVQNRHLPYLKDQRLKGPVEILNSSSTFLVWRYAA